MKSAIYSQKKSLKMKNIIIYYKYVLTKLVGMKLFAYFVQITLLNLFIN